MTVRLGPTRMIDGGAYLGVDVGGTFTDLVAMSPASGAIVTGKVLTTPDDPSDAVMAGSEELLARCGLAFGDLARFIHATTLVANSLIQRTGARVALVITEGFVDCLETGIENRYDLYDLMIERPEPYVPRRLRFGISERTAIDGTRLRPVAREEVGRIAEALRTAEIEAVAVCLLNGFRNPTAEREVRSLLADALPGIPITLSSDVAPEVREYQRATTTVANAYVQPLVRNYLSRLAERLAERGLSQPLFVMLSEGGIGTVATAEAAPIRLVESGPAAGAMAAAAIARRAGIERALAFDMGGTTAKLCLVVRGEPVRTYTTEVAHLHRFKRGSGLPLKIPSIELIEIGTGGGSIAHFDHANLLRIGPRSAGAVPGPACYGRGGNAPTVTDADLIAGYIDPSRFLGGQMALDADAATSALLEGVGQRLGLSAQDAAVAVLDVVNENMAQAARMHTIEHSEDARGFTLIAFGGAGPLHAWRMADLLKLERVLVPARAGVISAEGLLVAPPAIELSSSHIGRLVSVDLAAVDDLLNRLELQARSVLRRAGVADGDARIQRLLECRYVGQAYEVQVPMPEGSIAEAGRADLATRFEQRYRELYGRTLPGGAIELLTWRVQARGSSPAAEFQPAWDSAIGEPLRGDRQAYFPGKGFVRCTVLDRYALQPGDRHQGPALVEEDETTTVVGPGARLEVDGDLNLVIQMA